MVTKSREIVVEVRGGCVQNVYCDNDAISVTVVDWDDKYQPHPAVWQAVCAALSHAPVEAVSRILVVEYDADENPLNAWIETISGDFIEHLDNLKTSEADYPHFVSNGVWSGETSGRLQGIQTYTGHGRVVRMSNLPFETEDKRGGQGTMLTDEQKKEQKQRELSLAKYSLKDMRELGFTVEPNVATNVNFPECDYVAWLGDGEDALSSTGSSPADAVKNIFINHVISLAARFDHTGFPLRFQFEDELDEPICEVSSEAFEILSGEDWSQLTEHNKRLSFDVFQDRYEFRY